MMNGTQNISGDSRRIARNTVFLYFRMLLTMGITLYTSRVVLAVLGIEDFGIYDVVSSVVTMFAFLNGSMVTSTQRYITFAIGKEDREEISKVFSNAVRIHLLIGLVVILLCETVGLWFLENKLVIPEERMSAARWVFQLSLLSFFINVTQVPYNAVIVAHEKMDIFAYISIIDVLLRLGIVFLLKIIPIDKLIAYAVLSFLVTQIVRSLYRIYCRRNFKECHRTAVSRDGLFKGMLQFAGWNLFGSLAWMMRDQGVNILLNVFFGPVVNAARGTAMKVSSAVQGFVSNFSTAINPQITKNYAQDRIDKMEELAYRGSRFSFLILFVIALPLMVTMDIVLNWWLVEVPANTGIFLQFILLDALINAVFSNSLITSLMATGNIRNYQIVVSSIMLLVVPAGYFMLRGGMPAYSIFALLCVISIVSGLTRYWFCTRQIGYDWRFFLRNVIARVLGTAILAVPLPLLAQRHLEIDNGLARFILLCLISIFCVVLSSLAVGISSNERTALKAEISKKFIRR